MNEFRIQARLMGTAFELVVVGKNQGQAEEWLEQGNVEIRRIEALLTEFRESSITAELNAQAGANAVRVPDEVFALLERCQRISRLTQGAFDITVAPLKRLYQFKNQDFQMPSPEAIRECLAVVGFHYLHLDAGKKAALLTRAGMRVSFAAIGKGYAADRVQALWRAAGVPAGVVNASGDLSASGTRADGSAWRVGIAHPDDRAQVLCHLPLLNAAAATSGDYEQFFMWKGRRYSHNVDPKTGLPLSGLKSVTVVAPSAELADALATAAYVMGPDTGLHFIDQLPRTHCVIIDERNATYFSKGLDLRHEA